jgi:hypothetical protein
VCRVPLLYATAHFAPITDASGAFPFRIAGVAMTSPTKHTHTRPGTSRRVGYSLALVTPSRLALGCPQPARSLAFDSGLAVCSAAVERAFDAAGGRRRAL